MSDVKDKYERWPGLWRFEQLCILRRLEWLRDTLCSHVTITVSKDDDE